MRQKRRIPLCVCVWGGGGGGYKMATHAIHLSPKDADSCSKVADLGKAANLYVTVGSKVADGPYVTSHVTMCGLGQSCKFSVNS
jgi:hypothetical protein